MTTIRNNRVLATRFYEEVINQRRIHVIDEITSETFVDHNPDPGQGEGREGVKNAFRQHFEAFPDLCARVESMVVDGDRVGARVTMEGTHHGTLAGIPATGRRVTMTGMDWLRIENGRAVERWGVFDMTGMMAQLGAIPGPDANTLKATSRRYYEILDRTKADVAALRELLHSQHVTHFAGQPSVNPEGLQEILGMLWGAFPDIKHEVVDQLCEGDTVFNRMKVTATHKGEFAGVAATNKKINVDVMTTQRYVNGLILEQCIEPDMGALLVQIGAIPTP